MMHRMCHIMQMYNLPLNEKDNILFRDIGEYINKKAIHNNIYYKKKKMKIAPNQIFLKFQVLAAMTH